MAQTSTLTSNPNKPAPSTGRAASASLQDLNQQFYQQCLRVLACTAKAMVTSPGGLRFQEGTRPWLEGLAVSRNAQAALPVASD